MKPGHEITPPTSTLGVLLAMRELLADERHWTKWRLSTLPLNDEEPARCLLGALSAVVCSQRFGGVRPSGVYHATMDALCNELPTWAHGGLSLFNDNMATRHADVLALIDRAIMRQA